MNTKSEFFKNQKQTVGMSERKGQAVKPVDPLKVLVLKLNSREQKALQYLGGGDALKQLLCPEGICLACRQTPVSDGADLCPACLAAGR